MLSTSRKCSYNSKVAREENDLLTMLTIRGKATATFLGLVLVCILAIVFSGLQGNRATDNPADEIMFSLVRKIETHDARKIPKVNMSGVRIPSKLKHQQPEPSQEAKASQLPSSYTVITVVPELKKVEFVGSQPWEVANESGNPTYYSWLDSSDAIDELVKQAGLQNQTYAWMQISQSMEMSLIRQLLREFNATTLGSSGDLVRLRVPNDKERLYSMLELPWVNGLGALPANKKISQSFREEINGADASEQIPVFVSVMDSESKRDFREVLKSIGVTVGPFDPTIRVFSVVINPGHVDDLTDLDFVQYIEPISIVTAMHDTAVPAQGVDKLRVIGELPGTFFGFTGTTTPIAVMDTGINTNHVDIATHRESICAKNFVDGEDSDLLFDANGHGTHVTGTVVGNGFYVPKYSGMAPGVKHIRFAKVLNTRGAGSGMDILQGMDFLSEESSCVFEGRETEAIKPLIVNMSLSAARLDFDSRSTGARKLDSTVWTHRQLYVVANSNSSQHGYSNYGAAKNSLPVGASYDMGDIHGFSSLGPTVDNRLMPLVSGSGVTLFSALGGGSFDDYHDASGTSMASPSVAGLAALLMDASPGHREQPALVRARLMASAVKPDRWFESESQFPLNNTNGPGNVQFHYGMGMVSATATILENNTEQGWNSSGAAVEMENNQYAYHDIDVPEGTSRLDVVMTWDEPPTDAIANNVLNDLDLWIDKDADCGTGPCGEYSSLSRNDNVEWVIVQNPKPGTYRLKIAAQSVYSDAPRAAIAWTIIRGDSTPQLAIEASEEIYETPIGENHSHMVDLTISSDSYVAKGVSLHIDCRTLDGKACVLGRIGSRNELREGEHSAIVQRSDGLGVAQIGEHFVLGEITKGIPTKVLMDLYADSRETMRIYVKALAWNGKADHTSFLVRPAGSIEDIPVVSPPSNDHFDNPIVLQEANGSQEFDLLVSSMEDGEPLHESQQWSEARAAGSVWFQRTATESGLASFVVAPTRREFPNRDPKVQVYQITGTCCGMLGAKLLASSNWSAQLFVTEGTEYFIRVSVAGESLPLTLSWFQGERPINDNFANAIELSGDSGEISGSNLGATIEAGELYGYLSSSVWYRWVAPDDGVWDFQIEDSEVVHVLVFVGKDVTDLRLVSNFAASGGTVKVHAKKEQTYHVMVASPNAYFGGWTYDALTWKKTEESID